MTCSMISLVMLEVFLQMSSLFMMSYAKFQLQSKKYVEVRKLCVEVSNFIVSRASSRLQKGKMNIGQKQALSSCQVSQVLSLLS